MDSIFTSSVELTVRNFRRLSRVMLWRIKRLRFINKSSVFTLMLALYIFMMYLLKMRNYLLDTTYVDIVLVLLPFIIGWYDHIVANRIFGHLIICFFELIFVVGIVVTYVLH